MADKKISQLTALSAANLAPSTDVLAIVDTSATETKKIVAQDLINGVLNVASAVGIGTASPGSVGVSGYTRLVLGAGSSATDGLTIVPSNTGGVQFTDAANVKKGYLQWDSSTGALALGTAGTTKATLDSSGNLGLGTSSPAARLHVEAGGGIVVSDSASTGSQVVIGVGTITAGRPFVGTNTSTNPLEIGTRASQVLVFVTDSTERGRFTAGGYFKASNAGTYEGSTAAYHELRTSQDDEFVARITNTASPSPYGVLIRFTAAAPNDATKLFLNCTDNASGSTQRAAIRSNGGLANYQANDVNLSDERTKKDIAPLGSMWDKIKALEIVTFKYKDQTHDDDNIGLIAQQVEAVAPEFVDADGWGETPEDGVPLKSIYTADMYHAAIKALQEAMARIESLEAKVSALEAK